MSTEKMREEFESWAFESAWLGIGDASQTIRDTDGTGYLEIELHTAWLAWQASRAAIEVVLPGIKGFEGAYDSYKQNEFVPFMTDVDDADEIFGLMRGIEVREAIESLGLKVKP